jgi:hypothetical protein
MSVQNIYEKKLEHYRRSSDVYKINKYTAKILNGGTKKCDIVDSDIVLFGDGGSTAIIAITKSKEVYKIFTSYYWTGGEDDEIKKDIERENTRVKTEINIYKLLTEKIKANNIPNHYVNYLDQNKCNNAIQLFKKCPQTYNEFLKIESNKKDRMCKTLMRGFPIGKLSDEYHVVQVEYCDYSSKDFINDVSNMDIIMMEKLLDIFFFQIIYTLVKTREIFPNFNHNDLFMRNILGKKENFNYNHYKYTYNQKEYFVPQILFYPKINDFGLTNLDENNKNQKLYNNEYKDMYNILYDVYNGGNLGAQSLSEILKDNAYKLKFVKKYFSNYFNVEKVDEFITKSKGNMDKDWFNILDDEFKNEIELKNPKDLLDNYFYAKFSKINTIIM